jgi:hypothetical protein
MFLRNLGNLANSPSAQASCLRNTFFSYNHYLWKKMRSSKKELNLAPLGWRGNSNHAIPQLFLDMMVQRKLLKLWSQFAYHGKK